MSEQVIEIKGAGCPYCGGTMTPFIRTTYVEGEEDIKELLYTHNCEAFQVIPYQENVPSKP